MNVSKDTLVIFTSDNGGVLGATPERAEALAREAGLKTNGDWRGGKHDVWEGGFRVPFIVRWPGRVPAGRVDDRAVLSAVDLLPTLCALGSATVPRGHTLDGIDVSAAWRGARPLIACFWPGVETISLAPSSLPRAVTSWTWS